MCAGHPKVDNIMMRIKDSIKEGSNIRHKQHYNIVYEVFLELQMKLDELQIKTKPVDNNNDDERK